MPFSRAQDIAASYLLILDESMSAWTGKSMQAHADLTKNIYKHGYLPHESWVPRKPEPRGCEIKTLVDARTYVMLAGEAEEGKAPMATKKYRDKWLVCLHAFTHTHPSSFPHFMNTFIIYIYIYYP